MKEFYRIGGAQAVAALAYGTKSILPVNKIVGPGNLYVTAAKKLVAFDCAIDFLAGPTEALVVQHSGRADFVASDLVAQAEHDPEAVCIFITSSAALAKKVEREVALQAENNPTALASLQENGVILVACSLAAYFSGCMTCSVDSGGALKTSSTLGHGCVRRIDSTNKSPVR